jgi:hypothetical protein
MRTLKVGDEVIWRGGFGIDPPQRVKVTGIEICELGEKYGDPVEEVEWSKRDRIVVDLENGRWAKGHQISPI